MAANTKLQVCGIRDFSNGGSYDESTKSWNVFYRLHTTNATGYINKIIKYDDLFDIAFYEGDGAHTYGDVSSSDTYKGKAIKHTTAANLININSHSISEYGTSNDGEHYPAILYLATGVVTTSGSTNYNRECKLNQNDYVYSNLWNAYPLTFPRVSWFLDGTYGQTTKGTYPIKLWASGTNFSTLNLEAYPTNSPLSTIISNYTGKSISTYWGGFSLNNTSSEVPIRLYNSYKIGWNGRYYPQSTYNGVVEGTTTYLGNTSDQISYNVCFILITSQHSTSTTFGNQSIFKTKWGTGTLLKGSPHTCDAKYIKYTSSSTYTLTPGSSVSNDLFDGLGEILTNTSNGFTSIGSWSNQKVASSTRHYFLCDSAISCDNDRLPYLNLSDATNSTYENSNNVFYLLGELTNSIDGFVSNSTSHIFGQTCTVIYEMFSYSNKLYCQPVGVLGICNLKYYSNTDNLYPASMTGIKASLGGAPVCIGHERLSNIELNTSDLINTTNANIEIDDSMYVSLGKNSNHFYSETQLSKDPIRYQFGSSYYMYGADTVGLRTYPNNLHWASLEDSTI